LAAALIFFARPVAVFLCLAPYRFGKRERFFIAWVGLRGAVSILLALVPVLGGVPHGETIFQISFLVVVASLLVQGWTVRPLARWLGLIVPEKAGLVDRTELDLPGLADHELVTYQLHSDSAVAQGRPLPRWARPLLLRRGDLVQNAPRTLQAGDRVYLLVAPRQVPLLDKLFGKMKDDVATEVGLYGDFTIAPEVTAKALRDSYDLPVNGLDDDHTVAELFRREFHSDLEIGDRLHLGPIDLIVREIEDGRITSVGISLEPTAKPLEGWERLTAKVTSALGLTGG
jgi:cell volume regulation protein A